VLEKGHAISIATYLLRTVQLLLCSQLLIPSPSTVLVTAVSDYVTSFASCHSFSTEILL